MTASQFREKARNNLSGKWGKAALITLIYTLITFLLSFALSFIPFVGNIAIFILEVPISYGILVSFIKLKRNEEVGYVDFLETAFSSFSSAWKVSGNILLKLILPLCLLIGVMFLFAFSITLFGFLSIASAASSSTTAVSTSLVAFIIVFFIGIIAYVGIYVWLIIKGLLYSQSFLILYDKPNATGKEIVEESERLMKGNRGHYFCLTLSFIGWIVLSMFSFGIGLLWVMPYIMIANIFFYENLIGKTNNVEVVDSATENAVDVNNNFIENNNK